MTAVPLATFDPTVATSDQIKSVQFYTGAKPDGDFGPNSTAALANWLTTNPAGATILCGEWSRYDFVPVIGGRDIFIYNGVATWFGGKDDPDDNGQTASGYSTRDNGLGLYCALPLPPDRACAGTPLPAVPWHTIVRVTEKMSGISLDLPVVDFGPAPDGSSDPLAIGDIDCSPGAFKAWGSLMRGAHGEYPKTGSFTVDVQILGAAGFAS